MECRYWVTSQIISKKACHWTIDVHRSILNNYRWFLLSCFPKPSGLLAFLESKDTVPLDDIDRLNTRDNLKIAEEDEKNKKNQVLDTLDRAYKSSVKKVEHLMEKHMDVSNKHVVHKFVYTLPQLVITTLSLLSHKFRSLLSLSTLHLSWYTFCFQFHCIVFLSPDIRTN